jgi:hypothetical protein
MEYSDADIESFRQIALKLFDGSADPAEALHFFTLGWVKQIDTNPNRWLITDEGSRQLDPVFIWPAAAPVGEDGFIGTLKAMRLRGTSQIDGQTVAAGPLRPDRNAALLDAETMADKWQRSNPLLKRHDKE